MKLSEFHYELPDELIAQAPLSERQASRLLSFDRHNGQLQDSQFSDLTSLLKAGDLLVFNNTKVIPARLFGRKASGGRVEILLERLLDDQQCLAQIRASKSPKAGGRILLENGSD